ncbi:MAG: citrate synthase family protein [Myxococcota bacterium]
MARRKTGRFDNPALPEEAYLSAEASCRRLGIKRASLYSYVGRHGIRTTKVGRNRYYHRSDIERIAVRSAARRGHGPVAAGALQWGEPVLDSALSTIAEGRLYYRGRDVVAWWRTGARFEDVVRHLWEATEVSFVPVAALRRRRRRPSAGGTTPVDHMVRRLLEVAESDPHAQAPASAATERARAARLIASLATTLGKATGSHGRATSLSSRVAARLGRADASALVEAVLVLCADHELNVSTFAVRVAASAGADLYGAVGAGLFTFGGTQHGTSSLRANQFVTSACRRGVSRAVRERVRRGDPLPGFGHALYPAGDPRVPPLLETARGFDGVGVQAAKRLREVDRVIDEVARVTGLEPNLDLGLVAVCRAAGWDGDIGSALFALGRGAGWVAHVFEQRRSPTLLRPRARYVGPPLSDGAGVVPAQ